MLILVLFYKKISLSNKIGDINEGEYKDGKYHGKRIFSYPDGSKYEGEYKNDKKHGKGIYSYPDGEKYEGEFKDDK